MKNVSAEKFKELIDTLPENGFVVLDVRTPEEYNQGHLAGAVNIDYYNPNAIEQIKFLDKSKTYLIYCRTGHRSLEIAQLMDKMDFGQIYNLVGGILSWPFEIV